VFRKPSDANPEEWPTIQMKSVQPVLTCVAAVLYGLSPGLTMSNKPRAHRHHVSVAQRAGRLLQGAAILAAFPAVAMVASLFSGEEPSLKQPGSAGTHSLPMPATLAADSSEPLVPQIALPEASPATHSATPKCSSCAPAHQPAVPVRQQVAMAKDLMMKLADRVWYGLEKPKRGQQAYPAVFHVYVSPGAGLPCT
jgi:hypothetical protein